MTAPDPFTSADYAARMARVAADAAAAGLAGVLVTPGPDLVWLTGYQPTAITERLTVLVISADAEPTLLVPTLERPDAEAAAGAAAVSLVDWTDGVDPYAGGQPADPARRPLRHLRQRLGDAPARPQAALPGVVVPGPDPVPADAARGQGRRTSWPGWRRPAPPPTRTYGEILKVRFAGRRETEVAADLAALLRQFGHEQVDFTVVGSGPNGANPHHEAGERVIEDGDAVVLDFGGLMYGYGSDTTRTVSVGEPSAELREVHEHRARRRSRPASTRSARASPARTSTGPRARSSPTPGTASSSSTAPATGSA